MTTNNLGFISAFDGVTLHSLPGKKCQTVVGASVDVMDHSFVLPNGTKINYDGTDDTPTSPSKIKVDFVCNTGAITLYNSLAAKMGHRGTLTKAKMWTGSETCIAVLHKLEVDEEKSKFQSGAGSDILFYSIEFDLVSTWS